MIKTQRLLLRPWREEDFDPFATMNADARVMEYFPAPLNRQESNKLAKQFKAKLEERGWGLWAVSLLDGDEFIGFIGLNPIGFEAHVYTIVRIKI